MSQASRLIFAFIAACALSLLSVYVERTGPELQPYGNLCGPTGNEDCLESVLKGGVPFAYLFDSAATSVLHQLAFVEDDFQLGAFVLDIAFYFGTILSIAWLVSRRPKSAGPVSTEQS